VPLRDQLSRIFYKSALWLHDGRLFDDAIVGFRYVICDIFELEAAKGTQII
jgi:hypothetical protein